MSLPPSPPAPRAPGCAICGHSPAEDFRFQYQNSWILASTKFTSEQRMCRDCAQSIGRAQQNRTLLTGWWGLLAFFRNLGAVATNARGLSRASRLSTPRVADESPNSAGWKPLDPGPTLLGRTGIWLSALVLAVAVGAMAAASEPPPGDPYRRPTLGGNSVNVPAATWSVGNCVSGTSYLLPVDCSRPHSGRIVKRVVDANICPYSAESWVQDLGYIYCIDDDL